MTRALNVIGGATAVAAGLYGGYVTAGAALGGPRAQTQQRPSSMRCSRSADATSGHDRAGPHPFQGGIESERDSVGHAVGGFPPWHRARLGDGLPGVRRHPSDGSHRRDCLLLICVPGGRAAPRSTSRNWAGSTGSVPSCSWTCGGRVSARPTALAGIATSIYNSSTGSPTATRPQRTT